jgi:hypothetical protein
MAQTQTPTDVVFQSNVSGLTVIPQPTSLTRLNYFDGKFLRAVDLQREQEYLRMLVEISNQGGGAGVVYGFDTMLGTGDQISLGPGMAIDPAGHVLMLPTGTSFGAQDLIDASRRITPVVIAGSSGSASFAECVPVAVSQGTVASGQDFYLLTIGWTEALCGEEDVYGRLCEAACATSTDRPYRVEGVVVRAVPFTPTTPLARSAAIALSSTHLRSQLASAFFADEAAVVPNLISKSGLSLDTWCLGAHLGGGQDVPLAVFVRAGTTTLFLDAWTARRERIETPPRRYWAWRMMMRPWDVYLAQILQFQCQLHDLILGQPSPGGASDPCKPDIQLLSNAAQLLNDIKTQYTPAPASPQTLAMRQPTTSPSLLLSGGLARLELVRTALVSSLQGLLSRPTNRVLINGGIIELPSAGYLPVDVGSTTVNDQVRKLLGEGLDLRFCVVRPDYVAHALEEAEHMERISLLTGIDHPDTKPKVDILVPNGQVVQPTAGAGTGVQGEMQFAPSAPSFNPFIDATSLGSAAAVVDGAGHVAPAGQGGWTFCFAATSEAPVALNVGNFALGLNAFLAADPAAFQAFTKLAQTRLALHANILADANLIPRVTTLAMAASDAMTAVRASTATPSVEAAPAPFAAPVAAIERRVIALWMSLEVDRNPFEMAPSDQTMVTSRITFVSPAKTPVFVDQRTQGLLTIKQVVAGSGGEMQVAVHLSGFSTRVATGVAQTTDTVEQDWGINLTYPPGQGPVLRIVNTMRIGSRTELQATWSGVPRTVQATVTFTPEAGQPTPVASATMAVNPDVIVPANPTHLQALAALQLVGAGIVDPAFQPTAERQLFPPSRQTSGEQIVVPTLDWVLFQRRREAICATAAPVAVPPKTYQLYDVLVQDPKIVSTLRSALLKNDWGAITQLGVHFRQVDQVQFGGGISALLTPSPIVLTDWKAWGAGNLLDYAALADRGATDQFLAQARLGSLEQAIASVTAADPSLVSETIPNIPAVLDVPGTDGIIVFVTHQQIQTICHTAYRLNLSPTLGSQYQSLLGANAAAAAAKVLADQSIATPLGSASFDSGSATPQPGDGIQAAWNKFPAATPLKVVVISSNAPADVASVPDAGTRQQQAVGVGNEIQPGSNVQVTSDFQIAQGIPQGDCPVIDVFVPSVRHHVIAVRNDIAWTLLKIAPPLLNQNFNKQFTLIQSQYDTLRTAKDIIQLGDVDFDPSVHPLSQVSSTMPLFVAVQNAAKAAGWRSENLEGVVSLFDRNNPPDSAANLTAQAVQVARDLIPGTNVSANYIAQGQPVPGEPMAGQRAPVLTLVLLGQVLQ